MRSFSFLEGMGLDFILISNIFLGQIRISDLGRETGPGTVWNGFLFRLALPQGALKAILVARLGANGHGRGLMEGWTGP